MATTPASTLVQQALRGTTGTGRPLPFGDEIQRSFGRHDIGGVRAYTGADATAAARVVGARAFTVGDRVAFAAAPTLHTAAHEAAHVVQQRAGVDLVGGVGRVGDRYERHAEAVAAHVVGGRSAEQLLDQFADGGGRSEPAVQNFNEWEHRELGTWSKLGGMALDIDLGDGTWLRYDELVSLGGDYFGSLDEVKALAKTAEGRATLRWTRWLAFNEGAEPVLSDDAKEKVRTHFVELASKNFSHFSAGGIARESYRRSHGVALRKAIIAGAFDNDGIWRDALAEEAFGNHYLTDSFSGGHVRTPRYDIKTWYDAQFPDSTQRFVSYLVDWLYDELKVIAVTYDHPDYFPPTAGSCEGDDCDRCREEAVNEMPASKGEDDIKDGIRSGLQKQGGAALTIFTLGDLVSGAYHDRDNLGLFVVSDVDPSGNAVAGGYHWQARGDSHLLERSDHPSAAEMKSPVSETVMMVGGAMRATQDEIEAAQRLGVERRDVFPRPNRQALSLADELAGIFGPPYGAEKFMPREDTSANNPSLSWKWGQFNKEMTLAVDDYMKKLADNLRQHAPTKPKIVSKYGGVLVCFHLHIDIAFKHLANHMASNGVGFLTYAMKKPS